MEGRRSYGESLKVRAMTESEVGDSLFVGNGMLQLAAQLVPRPSSPPPP